MLDIFIGTAYGTDEYEQSRGVYCIKVGNNVLSKDECDISTNQLVLKATTKAMEVINVLERTDVLIHTHNDYLAKGINNWLKTWKDKGWYNSRNKPVVNNDLWKRLDKLLDQYSVSAKLINKTDYCPEMNICQDIAINELCELQNKVITHKRSKRSGLLIVRGFKHWNNLESTKEESK